MACVGLLSAQAAPAKPIKLEGMEYLAAQKIILGYGWKPVKGDFEGGGATSQTCAQFPELDNCECCGVGHCDMLFDKPDQCLTLRVITIGGPPQPQPADTEIDSLDFHHGACRTKQHP